MKRHGFRKPWGSATNDSFGDLCWYTHVCGTMCLFLQEPRGRSGIFPYHLLFYSYQSSLSVRAWYFPTRLAVSKSHRSYCFFPSKHWVGVFCCCLSVCLFFGYLQLSMRILWSECGSSCLPSKHSHPLSHHPFAPSPFKSLSLQKFIDCSKIRKWLSSMDVDTEKVATKVVGRASQQLTGTWQWVWFGKDRLTRGQSFFLSHSINTVRDPRGLNHLTGKCKWPLVGWGVSVGRTTLCAWGSWCPSVG